jgi:hypothetical protein
MLINLRETCPASACGNLASNIRRMQQKSCIWPNLLQTAFNTHLHERPLITHVASGVRLRRSLTLSELQEVIR